MTHKHVFLFINLSEKRLNNYHIVILIIFHIFRIIFISIEVHGQMPSTKYWTEDMFFVLKWIQLNWELLSRHKEQFVNSDIRM